MSRPTCSSPIAALGALLLLATLGFSDCEAPVQFVFIDGPEQATFTEAQTVTIAAGAAKQDGLAIKEMRFYRDGDEHVGTDTTAPYSYRWPITREQNGIHRFHAEADYAWRGGGETLRSEEAIYEVAIDAPPDPAGPGQGHLTGLGRISDTALDSGRAIAWVASSDRGLTVVDIGDPERPRSIGRLDLDYSGVGVATDRSYAYVVQRIDGPPHRGELAVVDVRSPSQPILIGIPAFSAKRPSADTSAGIPPRFIVEEAATECVRESFHNVQHRQQWVRYLVSSCICSLGCEQADPARTGAPLGRLMTTLSTGYGSIA